MPIYDLIIIGNTPEAIYGAKLASSYNARVALVTQSNTTPIGTIQAIFNPRVVKQIPLNNFSLWAKQVIFSFSEQNSLSSLSALGVDVINGSGTFRLPQLALIVNNRHLRSRSYLIATGCQLVIPQIPGIEEVNYFTPHELWQTKTLESFNNIVIIGSTAIGITVAQTLNILGKKVILAVETSEILPQQDLEASRLIQAQLESVGVEVMTQSPLLQCKRLENKNWLQLGNQVIEADAVFFAAAYKLNVDSLNLGAVGIKSAPGGVQLNYKARTTNPQIYACGQIAKSVQNIAQYEAKIATKNALFFPFFKANYRYISQTIMTDPPLAKVGLTEAQARKLYGSNIAVLRDFLKNIPAPQISGETTGFCKIILSPKGEIIGAHVVGAQAGELIALLAIAMKHHVNIQGFSNFFPSALTFGEIISETVVKWNFGKNKSNKFLINFCKTWFKWRR